MPVYTVETPTGKRLKIEAPDEATAMQGAEEYDLEQASQPKPPMSWQDQAQDVADVVGTGLTRAVTAIPGTPGTLRDLAVRGENWLMPDAAANRAKAGAEMPDWIPSNEQIFGWLPNIDETTPDALNYEAKSPVGKFIQPGVDFAANALMPGGWIRKGIAVVGPAIATETASRVAKKFAPEWEPQIRAGTAIITSILASRGGKGIKELSTDELKKIKDQAYAIADANGEMVAPGVFDAILADVGVAAYDAGARPGLADKAITSLKYADEYSGKPIAVAELDKVRQLLKSAGGSADATERGVSKTMVQTFDEGLDANAINAHAEARKANQAFKRSELVDDLQHDIDLKASKFSLSGRENATRDVYRQLARNKAKMRQFDQATQDAINRVAMGGPVENAARLGGKFAPTGPIPTLGAVAAGGGDWGTAAAIMAPGAVSRLIATGLTSRNRQLAEALIKHGGEEGMKLFNQAKGQRERELIVRALLSGSVAVH